MEKSLNSSILLAWDPPLASTQILGYQVLLDHSVYNTVRATDRTRALIENLDFKDKPHRISIRTITQRGLSHEQKCTLLLNSANEVSIVPTELRVDRVNQTSAIISWWVASNEVAHQLLVNDVELQTLQPGVYRFKLSGLVPNTMHKVTIRAKPSVTSRSPQQLSTSLDFRTTPFGTQMNECFVFTFRLLFFFLDESIEPPSRVQAILGPQSNTLLVSWEPVVSPSTFRGYRILADGRQVQDILNPLSRKMVIRWVCRTTIAFYS